MAAVPQIVKNSPVTSLTTIEAITGFVLTFLVAHQVIGNVDISATTQTIAPFAALVIPAVFGALKHTLVTPYAKVKDLAEQQGIFSDADFGRMESLVEAKFALWLAADEANGGDGGGSSNGNGAGGGGGSPKPAPVPTLIPPGGMSGGIDGNAEVKVFSFAPQ